MNECWGTDINRGRDGCWQRPKAPNSNLYQVEYNPFQRQFSKFSDWPSYQPHANTGEDLEGYSLKRKLLKFGVPTSPSLHPSSFEAWFKPKSINRMMQLLYQIVCFLGNLQSLMMIRNGETVVCSLMCETSQTSQAQWNLLAYQNYVRELIAGDCSMSITKVVLMII